MYRFQKNPKILNPKIPQTVESILQNGNNDDPSKDVLNGF